MGERKFTESQAERIELFQDVYEGRIPNRFHGKRQFGIPVLN